MVPVQTNKKSSPLLSRQDSIQRAKPLLCWRADQTAQVHAALSALLVRWRADWVLPAPGTLLLDPGRLLNDSQAHQALAERMFGRPLSTATLAPSLVMQAWTNWQTLLAQALGRTTPLPIAQESPSPWDGSLLVQLPWWQGHWLLHLDAQAVKHLLGDSPTSQPTPRAQASSQTPLTPISAALSGHLMEVRAHLSPARLTLGQIQSLRIGDIIPLPQQLNQPAALMLLPGVDQPPVRLCDAWLGQRAGHMAAELDAVIA